MRMTLLVVVCASFLVALALVACAGSGTGNDPSFGGLVVTDGESSADGGASDDAAPAGDDAESADATCPDDPTHALAGLAAALSGHATVCTLSSQCPAGQCCYVSNAATACIMQ